MARGEAEAGRDRRMVESKIDRNETRGVVPAKEPVNLSADGAGQPCGEVRGWGWFHAVEAVVAVNRRAIARLWASACHRATACTLASPRTRSVPNPLFLKFALTRSIRPLFFITASASSVAMRCRQSLMACGSFSRCFCRFSSVAGLTSVRSLTG